MQTPPLETILVQQRRNSLTRSQIKAMKKAYQLAERILETHPSVVEEYRKGEKTYLELARIYASKELEEYPRVALSAIGQIIRTRLPAEERTPIVKNHTRHILSDWLQSLDPEELKEFLRKSKEGRRNKGLGNEGNTEGLFRSCGITPWNEEQRIYLLGLLKNTQYRWQNSSKVGYPNYEIIINALTEKFGITRTKPSIDCQISYLKEQGYQIPKKLEIK